MLPTPLELLLSLPCENSCIMAMAPKKKFDFFNGGRGIVLTDTTDVEESSVEQQPPEPKVVQESYGYGGDYGRYSGSSEGYVTPSSPGGYMPPGGYVPPRSPGGYVVPRSPGGCVSSRSPGEYVPPDSPNVHQYHGDYPCPTTSGSQSPTGYGTLVQEGFSPTDFATATTSDSPPLPSTADDDDGRKKGKRKQRCRMCANHGIYVEVKGHKWYCPYRENHNCEKCEITRKRQYYMAEQQKLTREQQQQREFQRGSGPQSSSEASMEVAPVSRPPATPSSFPREEEMVRETSNIIDRNEDLFEMINQFLRPRTQH